MEEEGDERQAIPRTTAVVITVVVVIIFGGRRLRTLFLVRCVCWVMGVLLSAVIMGLLRINAIFRLAAIPQLLLAVVGVLLNPTTLKIS